MKSKSLKIEKPCDEEWEDMEYTENGRFCDLCSKNVIDLTQLNQLEITELLKGSDAKICVRMTQKQLSLPLIDIDTTKNYNLTTNHVAIGLMIAATLSVSQPLHSQNNKIKTEFIQASGSNQKTGKSFHEIKSNPNKYIDLKVFKGKIISIKSGEPIADAKISLITPAKIFQTYSDLKGSFSLEIPESVLQKENVVNISFDHKSNIYETKNFIFTREEINQTQDIKIRNSYVVLGQLSKSYNKDEAILLIDNKEVKLEEIIKKISENKANKIKKLSDVYDIFYLEPNFAKILRSKNYENGIYVFKKKE
ncbi:hypothetical protein [Psychroflexus halocasei]|uniref:CarboxypepD_reg-like domain-containing protein n=1 Tax=Psychroflexus halocasei TaxID=908615 RepID=A0A1H4C7U7_9FLAO|nr:hypothetical protein [Psychroflexus halocasei]SEA56419.1 hypothetical protein SAMN05421540_10782 [Psychroflexus halocasei]